jgi:hypothetical protein
MYQRGAHGVNLFNFGHLLFGHGKNTQPTGERLGTVWLSELHPDYYRVLQELRDVRTLQFKDKHYVLESIPHDNPDGEVGKTHRQFRAVEGIRLPVRLDVGRHRVDFGIADDLADARQKGVTAQVTLRLKLSNYTPPDELDVAFNGQDLPRKTRTERAVFIMNDFTWMTYPIPNDLVKSGMNAVEISVRALNPQMSEKPVLNNLEVWLEFEAPLHGEQRS